MEVLCLVWMGRSGCFPKDRVAWAIEMGITTATFNIRYPHPDTAFYQKIESARRILTDNWDLYDTRHVTFRPKLLSKLN